MASLLLNLNRTPLNLNLWFGSKFSKLHGPNRRSGSQFSKILREPDRPEPRHHYIEQYTSQELAYLVLRRTRAEGIQETRTKLSPALTRRFPIDNFDVTAIILIHGGRWLLTTSGTSSVLYYDLDARQPVKTLLIQNQMEYLPGFQMLQVSFNLVLYLSSGNASCLFH